MASIIERLSLRKMEPLGKVYQRPICHFSCQASPQKNHPDKAKRVQIFGI